MMFNKRIQQSTMSLETIFMFLLLLAFNSGYGQTRFKNEVFDSLIVTTDLQFGKSPTQGGKIDVLKMDIYQPKGDVLDKRPLIVLAHGGHFMFGDKHEFSGEAEVLAKAGFVVACINYRLIDVEPSDTASMKAVIDAIHDLRAAVRFFNKDAIKENKYRIDPTKVIIGGYSAGAVTSLHYAYANTIKDVVDMGGEWLLEYVERTGGFEGRSGNPGFQSQVCGVINFAGSMHSANLLNVDEPFLVSVHGTNDKTVPFNAGATGTTAVITEGSGLIHARAEQIGLANLLIAVEGADHLIRFSCDGCLEQIMIFLATQL